MTTAISKWGRYEGFKAQFKDPYSVAPSLMGKRDWRDSAARTVFTFSAYQRIKENRANFFYKYSEELFLLWRLVGMGYFALSHFFWLGYNENTTWDVAFIDFWPYVTIQTAVLSLCTVTVQLFLHIVAYVTLHKEKRLLSQLTLSENEQSFSFRNSHAVDSDERHIKWYQHPLFYWWQRVQNAFIICLFTMNVVVITVYWSLLHDYAAEGPIGDYWNWVVHAENFIFITDFCLNGVAIRFYNGIFAATYGLFYLSCSMIPYELKWDIPVYEPIDPFTTTGIIIVLLLLFVVVPCLTLAGNGIKHKMMKKGQAYFENKIKEDKDRSDDTAPMEGRRIETHSPNDNDACSYDASSNSYEETSAVV